MRLLVTAGNTQAPIDRVRCITNIFTGRTGASIALRAQECGHTVTLFTSHPEALGRQPAERWTVHQFRTFDDLRTLMADHVPGGQFDAIIHCAAVSDYLADGIYANPQGPQFEPAVGKLKSDSPEIWLRLVRAPKLIDAVRSRWGFRGVLVKFKLEVGVDDEQLLTIAEQSRRQSQADLMVANTLEDYSDWAFVGPIAGKYERISRSQLADTLLDATTTVRKGQ
jgi:phosphopantothenate-cysteine ligase/phosphopantothenoylcysteine decarboxylase/phosphopantothenate--cysteine ligase